MADVKKVNGFHAVDGTFHSTRKGAIEHSDAVKVQAALKAFADSVEDEDVPDGESVDAFLYRHRAAISAAFGMKAQLRASPKSVKKPRKALPVNLTAGA